MSVIARSTFFLFLCLVVSLELRAETAVPNAVLGAPRPITFVGPRAGEGYFSADGQLMIFQSEREAKNPFYQIYLMNRENGRTVRVSPGEGKTTCAWIHPSKQKALFSSTHLDSKLKEKTEQEWAERKNPVKGKYSWSFDETFDLFEAPIAAALKTGKAPDAKNLKRLTTEPGYDAEASYSPDGDWIAFASNRTAYLDPAKGGEPGQLSDAEKKLFAQDPSYMMDLYLMKSDGRDVQRLTTERGYDGGPFFSADGKRLTWRRFAANGQTAEIMAMDLKTRKETQLTKMKGMSWAPFFHPSGDYLVFTSNKLGYSNFELFIVDADGKHEPVQVSFLEGFDGLPVFLPNGRELSWTRRDERGDSQIVIADWDDGLARSLLGLGRAAPTTQQLSKAIEEGDLRAWVSYLASDAMKGRRSGSPEERQYAEAIGRALKAMGLSPVFGKSYVQPFEFTAGVKLGPLNRLRLRDKGVGSELALEKEWMPTSLSRSADVAETGAVFVGYGLVAPAGDQIAAFDSYGGAEVGGKWAVVLRDMPADIAMPNRLHFNLYSRLSHKAMVAKQKGAAGLIVVDAPSSKATPLSQLQFEGASELGLPIVQLSQEAAKRLFAGATALKSKIKTLDKGEVWTEALKVTLGGKVDLRLEKATGLNIAAKRAGSNPSLAPLIVGAHADHLGFGEGGAMGGSLAKADEMGRAHVGADDNASGVASVLEMAHAIAGATRPPDRDVIFALWSAEELGILGSAHFTAQWKGVKPLAYLNLDMVGRLRGPLSVQGVGSATEWRQYLEEWAVQTALPLSTTSDPYLPTDAMSFYLKEIPILSFFTGAHAEYHSPRDRYETLNFAGMKQVTETIVKMVNAVSARSTKLTYQKVKSDHGGDSGSRSFRLYLGTVPDYTQEVARGVKISGTSKDSPAEAAGLRPGDVIVGLGGIKVDTIYDYVYCLQSLKADVAIPIQIVRSGKTLELSITPQLKR